MMEDCPPTGLVTGPYECQYYKGIQTRWLQDTGTKNNVVLLSDSLS